MSFRRGLVVAGGLIAVTTMAVAYGATKGPGPGEAVAPAETPRAAATLTEPEGADAIPTPKKPRLLGLDEALPNATPSPRLAFEIPTGLVAGDAGVSDAAVPSTPGAGVAAADDEEVFPTDNADLEVGEDEPVAEPEPFPTPPPPPRSGFPSYADPSPAIIAASGRPFEVLRGNNRDSQASTGTTRGITETTITVGGLASQTLVDLDFRVDVCLGAEARFAQANQYQELTRSVVFEGCYDDAAQPDLSTGLVNTLVGDGVFAIVPLASPAFGAEDILRDERVPYVGDEALPGFCGRTSALGVGTWGAQACPVLDARGFVFLAEPVLTAYLATVDAASVPSIAYVVEQGPKGDATVASRSFEAELLGAAEPTFLAILAPAAQGAPTNWTEVATAVIEAESDVVMLEGAAIDGLPAALRSLGFKGELVLVGHFDSLTAADTDSRLAVAPATIVSPGVDLATRRGDGWDALSGAAASVGLAAGEIGLDFVEGYVAADLLLRAISDTAEPLTVERLANTINSGWWYPGVDGVACGSWWPASHFVSTPCVSISRVDVFGETLVPVLGLVETEPQVRFELGNG